ncbi:zinc finger protein 91-like isoform X2 [Sabethes cyaneus]|uniref:zinc finger protein 91-like isoform X2 n=1 Tax=Sabethes cyaneus TaxID=53552 RepID=UPI00237D424B|nr:zinc finger protein 91-like isoform X2 [Sabethes cyaneus]
MSQSNIATESGSPVEEKGQNCTETHRCDLCSALFRTRALLARHIGQSHKAVKKFHCTECSASFNSQKNIALHRTIHGPKPFKCPKCLVIFRRYATLVGHIERHYVPEDNICVVCNREFPTLDGLKAHVLEGHEADAKEVQSPKKKINKVQRVSGTNSYQCTLCENKVFSKMSLFERHLLIHTKQKPFTCNDCGKSFNQKSSLKTHSLIHSDIRDFMCSLCGLKFSQKVNLRVHTLRVHPKKNASLSDRLACPYCPCVFKKLGSLNAHKTKIHAALLPNPSVQDEVSSSHKNAIEEASTTPPPAPDTVYHCGACDMNFQDMAQLDSHMNQHSVVQPQIPEIVRPIISNRTQSHLQGANEQRRFSCNICPAAFKKSSHLKQHLKSHYGIKGNRCEICDKTFTTGHTLKVHRSSHTQSKQLKYKCELCPTQFSLLSSVRRHMKLHDNPDRCYSCPYCKRLFKWYQNCRTHIRKVHPDGEATTPEQSCPPVEHVGDQNEAVIHVEEIPTANETLPAENVSIVDVTNCIVRIDDQLYEIPLQIDANGSFLPISLQELSVAEPSEPQQPSLDLSLPSEDIILETHETVYQYFPPSEEIPQEVDSTICDDQTSGATNLERAVFPKSKHEHLAKPSKRSQVVNEDEQDLFGETVVAGKKHYFCKACEKRFKKPVDLRRHIRSHTGERPFHCDLCSKSFTLKAVLQMHMKTHDLRREMIVCPEPNCGKKFSSKTSLDMHRRIHSGDRPFQCSVCTLTFRTSGHMQAHMTSHSRLAARREQSNLHYQH